MNLDHFFQLQLAACGTRDGFLPGLYDGIKCTNGNVDVTSINDFLIVIANVVRILIALSGGLAVIFIIVGGVFYVTAAGDPGRLKRAKEIITQAITGLIVVLLSYAVVTFIAGRF
jgi:hypothetical protein